MSTLTANDVRERYLRFFEQQGHVRIPSAPLIPENDPTTLFTGSGMQPMVPYLLGQPHPSGKRITDSQKSFRVTDIEDVGDNRHTTFFEMLGNWSLGDYFKAEQIPWMFTFLTRELGLDPQRLYITVFRGNEALSIPRDDESVQLWQNEFKKVGVEAVALDFAEKEGMRNGRIFYYDETKNWWSRAGVPANMPDGEPGGPDSEMFWDFGPERRLHEQSPWSAQPCHVNCDCGRFLEIGNNVFMEYQKTADSFTPLPQRNVDFGGGLERMLAAAHDTPDVFLTPLFAPWRTRIEELSGKRYGQNETHTKAFRVLMDHVRAATFLIGDGVVPATKDQGYFTRRLIRRAVRFAHHLGIPADVCSPLAGAVIASYAEPYPQLPQQAKLIMDAMSEEEAKFRATLLAGLRIFERIANSRQAGETIAAAEAFDLYQSYGFPLEMTEELAQEQGLHVDTTGFTAAFKQHQELSRVGAEKKFKGGLADHSEKSIHYHTATHLLHQALRTVLGPEVFQRGSNITPERLRFDFSYPHKLSPEQRHQVEELVNEQIAADLPVTRQEMTVTEAKTKGALGLFEHKYGEKVSVYTVGNFSIEICGGPHVTHTGVLGTFRITKEEAASAGIRRIKAILE